MTVGREVAYLDASAFLKLILPERESMALREALTRWPWWASSALLEVEAVLGVRRRDPHQLDPVRRLLSGLLLLDSDADVRQRAGELGRLRSLAAIHLATALSLGDRCGVFFAYDGRLEAAARAHGLTVSVPGR
jgi:uncharacterized protein